MILELLFLALVLHAFKMCWLETLCCLGVVVYVVCTLLRGFRLITLLGLCCSDMIWYLLTYFLGCVACICFDPWVLCWIFSVD